MVWPRWWDGFTLVAFILLALLYLVFGLAAAHEGLGEIGAPAWLSVVIVGTLLLLRLSLVLVGLAIYGAYAGWGWNFFLALVVFAPAVAIMFAAGASAILGAVAEALGHRWRNIRMCRRLPESGRGSTGDATSARRGHVMPVAKAADASELQRTADASSRLPPRSVARPQRPPFFAGRYAPLAILVVSVSALAVVLVLIDETNSGRAVPPRQEAAVPSRVVAIPPAPARKPAESVRGETPAPTQTLIAASGLRLTVPGHLNVREVPVDAMPKDRTQLLAGAWELGSGERKQLLLLKGSDRFLPRFRYAEAMKSPLIKPWRDHIARNIQQANPSAATVMRPTSANGLFKALLTNLSQPGMGECLVGAVLADNQLAELTLCAERDGVDETMFDVALASLEALNPSVDFQKGSVEERLNMEYWAARERLPEAESLLLRNEQRHWAAEREATCGSHAPLSSEFFACLDRAATERIQELASYGDQQDPPQASSNLASTPTNSATSSGSRGGSAATSGL